MKHRRALTVRSPMLVWLRPRGGGHCGCVQCSCFCAVGSSSTACTPASELQATVAMEAPRASWGGCLFTWSNLPRPCSSLPALSFCFFPWSSKPTAIVRGARELQRHQSGLRRREAPPPRHTPPRSRSTVIYSLCPQTPPSEHTLKLTM